ncbi:MAG: hypothetical protein ACYCZF_17665 [Anaerolineae bacterium]
MDTLDILQTVAVSNQVACADAHSVANTLAIEPIELGKVVTRASGLRFNRCQLGLFGYGSKAEGKSKIVMTAVDVPPEIETALRVHLVDGVISCLAVWQVAEQFKYPRLGLANIVQSLGFKVAPCQLGCF